MCDPGNHAEATPVEALPASAGWKGEVLRLEPVDELSVLTVCNNTVDILLPDQGPVKRLRWSGWPGRHRCWKSRRCAEARSPTRR